MTEKKDDFGETRERFSDGPEMFRVEIRERPKFRRIPNTFTTFRNNSERVVFEDTNGKTVHRGENMDREALVDVGPTYRKVTAADSKEFVVMNGVSIYDENFVPEMYVPVGDEHEFTADDTCGDCGTIGPHNCTAGDS